VGGDPVAGVSTLNGSPYERYWMSSSSTDEIWDAISAADSRKDLMQLGTPCGGGRTPKGMVKCHAYTVLGVA
jgi:hypothetical protein